jgi:large repetitive protein
MFGRRFRSGAGVVSVLTMAAITFTPLVGTSEAALVSSVPSNYFTVVDSGGVNDENGGSQLELTQMGRDDSNTSFYQLFWSWDATDFQSQTGDACALFDSDGDGNVNFDICAQIQNAAGSTIVQTNISPTAHTCNDSRADRCGTPGDVTPGAGQLVAGPIEDITNTGGNLVTATDPFAGQVGAANSPNDSTVAVKIAKSLLPTSTTQLVNVCDYESIANGGNNNPNDCIVNPGGGFLSIVKHTTGGDSTFNFSVSAPSNSPTTLTRSITTTSGTGTAAPASLIISTNNSVTETVPSGWLLTGISCTKESGGSTGTLNLADNKITAVAIESGLITTCTFADTKADPELTLDKSADRATYSAVGQVINYTYTLTNSGNVPLTSPYAVNDNKITAANIDCSAGPSTLAVGDHFDCTASHTATQADLDAGSITNLATATAKFNGDTVTSNQDTVTVTANQSNALTLVKTSSDSSYDHVGQVLNYTYTLTNSGNVTLHTPYDINDDKVTDAHIDCTAGPASLAPAAHFDCTGTYTVTQADLDAGSITNHATATATWKTTADTLSNEDHVTIQASQTVALTLVKNVTETSYDHVGQVLHYTYTLTNSGNVTLHSPYDINDDLIGDAHIDCTVGPADLAPGAHFDCTGTYTVTQADLDAGSITNHATATASWKVSGDTESNEDDAYVPASQNNALSLDKQITEGSYDTVGQVLHYTYVLTNTGNVTLHSPYDVNDDLINDAQISCSSGPADLAPGAHFNCTGTYTVDQADLDAGSITNHATATATWQADGDTQSNEDHVTVNAEQDNLLSLDKQITETSYDHVGQVLHYTYVLTNIGNVTLHSPYDVNDDLINDAQISCSSGPAILAPGAFFNCTGTYTVTQADLDKGHVTNHATATATWQVDGDTQSAEDHVTVNADQNPALSLDKNVAEETYAAVGQVLHYTYTLTNTGNVTLHAPYAVDDNLIDGTQIDCTAGPADLAPGAQFDCTGTYTVTQADLDNGSVTNLATATATFGEGTVESNPDSVTVPADQLPALQLVKNAAESSYSTVGDVLHYTYTLTNSGNLTLHSPYVVNDDRVLTAAIDCSAGPADLAPGASFDCAAAYTVTQADIDAGQVTNIATATATLGEGTVTSNQDTVTVPALQNPALKVVKSVDKSSASYGDTLTYTLAVTNTGNETLTGVNVSDLVPAHTTYVNDSAAPADIASFVTATKTVHWAVGTLAVGQTVGNLTFQVVIDKPQFDPTVGLPPEVIDNVAVAGADAVTPLPSNHVRTPVITVLGEKVVKTPPKVLPFTGSALPIRQAGLVGLLMIVVGIALTATRRRRRNGRHS